MTASNLFPPVEAGIEPRDSGLEPQVSSLGAHSSRLRDLNPEEEAILARIDLARLPVHIACIMDGNGRWARTRARERVFGHHAARGAVRQAVDTCDRLGVRYLTLYTFSSENWKRPKAEVFALMQLLKDTLAREKDELNSNNVRLRVLGDCSALPDRVRLEVEDSVALMRNNTGLNLSLAINYGGRQEILRATRALVARAAAGQLSPESLTEALFDAELYTAGLPDPELLIRTGGEQRISNFLLWQLAYTELWVSPVLWPDFSRSLLLEAIRDYQERNRRFGGL
ncbi:MAG: isoprenyl transferase [Candidatus Wallbacteria bacterium]|nr:isoprenyl transferase [Candidatus Wallbacteria bacterium]